MSEAIGIRIKSRRMELDLPVDYVAEKIGKSRATVYRWEKGDIRGVPSSVLARLAQILMTTPGYLITGDETQKQMPKDILAVSFNRVPLVGKIAAGEPIYDEYTDEYVSTQLDADCAMVIKGNSMYPRYQNGDIIYIKCQSDITYEGQIAVVIVDDEATLKHVYHIKDGLLLKSENPDYPDMTKTFKDYANIRILGYVQGFLRIERR